LKIQHVYIKDSCAGTANQISDKMDKDFTRYRRISLHGASLEMPAYWSSHFLGEVDNKCGDIFGQVFKQYNYVYMVTRKDDDIQDVVLTPDSHLLTVMRMLKMDLKHGDIDIHARDVVPADKKKVRMHVDGGYWVHEEEVEMDAFVSDKFEKVFGEYKYVYVKSDKALEYNKKGEHRVNSCDRLDTVLRALGLENEAVIDMHAEKSE
jgi:hypothetical protein